MAAGAGTSASTQGGQGGLTADEIAAVLDRCLPTLTDGPIAAPPTAVLAVSGGADSMALMHIFAEGLRNRPHWHLVVATVDHRLRAESAAEAAFVAAEAAKLGLPHHTLVWHGPKPSTGVQAAARAARYSLLATLVHALATSDRQVFLVTAHTLDDQVETFLMRLARGSGATGLSAIRRQWPFAPEAEESLDQPRLIEVVRPLLEVPKARLVATLEARNARWIEDPSNHNPAFERVRMRRLAGVLADAGLPSAAIARSAQRLRKAADAVEAASQTLLADPALVIRDPLGFIEVAIDVFADARLYPTAVGERALAMVLRLVGGDPGHQSLEAIEGLYERIHAEVTRRETSPAPGAMALGTTLARVKIERHERWIRFMREAGRHPPEPLPLTAGKARLWDHRLLVGHDRNERVFTVQSVGRSGVAQLVERGLLTAGVPVAALRVAPGFWDGNSLIAVPGLAPRWSGAPQQAEAVTAGCWCRWAPFAEKPADTSG